ncbi:MAG: hypothetical protein AB7F75_12465 [Planctomycetota bacterium]
MSHDHAHAGHALRDAMRMPPKAWTLPLAAVGIAVGAGSYALDHHRFWFSFLTAFLFLMSISLGGLVFVVIQHLVRARWSVVVRRQAEHLMMNIRFLALLAIPLFAFGMEHLYHHWMHPGDDPILAKKLEYLNPQMFTARTALYFLVWLLLSWYFYSRSVRQDTDGNLDHTRGMQKVSTVGAFLVALSLSFAAFDWIMSLDPHWFSTMFGVYYLAGCFIAIHTSLIVVVACLRERGWLTHTISTEHDHDLGKLSFGFTIFWAYIAYSQFMLIWYANLPEETYWYAKRWDGSWWILSLALLFGRFFAPFFFLMSRHVKRRAFLLKLAAVWMLTFQYLDVYWLVMPSYEAGEGHDHVMAVAVDMLCLVGFGLAFLALFVRRQSTTDLVPTQDPRLAESLCFTNG